MILPFVIGVVQVFGTSVAASGQPDVRPLDLVGYLLLGAGPLALTLRRRVPLLVLSVAVASTAAYLALDFPRGPFFLAGLVALFAAAKRAPRGPVWALTVAGYVGYLGAAIKLDTVEVGSAIATAVWVMVALVLAEANRARSEHFAQMGRAMAQAKQAKADAQRAEEEQTRRQAADERLRIAQELHDVLGHHLSLINVRAGVALHLLDSQPEQARDALGAIKQASAEALHEVRGVLAALRPPEESAPRSPSPGLDRVEQLGQDLVLEVHREGTIASVPPAVERAGYRIVQESLTNVRRHAGAGATVTVSITYLPTDVRLRVDDTGVGPPSGPSAGNGIPGMRERAAALGGRLTTGPRPGGGFRVEATLPLPESVVEENA